MDRKSQAYDYIKDKILNNEFPQGSPIREMELSEALQMSRTPIREALRELETEGVVVSYPARGSFVATITPYDVEEICDLRILCEQWALEKGFHRFSPEELDRMEASFRQAYEPFDWARFHQADRAFHKAIIDKGGSRRLANFVATLNTQIERVRRYGAKDPQRAQNTLAEHLRILDCIRSGNLSGAQKALREHLRKVSASAMESCRIMEVDSSWH